MLLRNERDKLLADNQYPAVSVYIPARPVRRELRQDAIRLGNPLSTAGPAAAILHY
jgi:hypothetical protein